MKVCFLFPGQGTDVERAGVAWCSRSEDVRRLVALAAERGGVPIDSLFLAAKGPTARTEVLQPVLTALCLGIVEALQRRGVRPDLAAGHSLGEVAACCCAGACTAEEAVAVAGERGRLMAREAARRPGGMVAVQAPDRQSADEAVALAGRDGIAALAAHNGPGQWVISGEWPALRRLATRHTATPLRVAGPWHSAAMAGAVEELRAAFGRHLTGALRIPLVANRTGRPVGCAAELPDLLSEQLTHGVQWAGTMATIAGAGVTDIVTVGPGRALRSLVRCNPDSGAVLHATDGPDDLEACAEALGR